MSQEQESQDTLPSWDDAAASAEKEQQDKTPTWEEATAKQDEPAGKSFIRAINPFQGSEALSEGQRLFAQKQPFWNVIKAFGQGYSDQYSEEMDETIKQTNADVEKDFKDTDPPVLKALVDGFALPAAKTMWTTFASAPFAGAQSALYAGGKEIAGEQFGRDLAALPEAYAGELPSLPHQVALPKANAVLEDEAIYMGTKEPTPKQAQEMHDAAQMYPKEEQTAPPDIHAVARQVAPEVFTEYDKISSQKDVLRNQLNDLSSERDRKFPDFGKAPEQIIDEQETIQNHINTLTTKKRLTKLDEEKLNDLQAQSQDLKDQHDYALGRDTPDMAEIRQKIQESDYRMRDLSPQVSAAYRDAENQRYSLPEKTTTEAELPEQQAAPQKPIQEQKSFITNDFAQKLIAVGRTEEEANAAAQLEAARYETLSAQYPKFSAEEWYNRESAHIKAGREVAPKAREFAQELEQKSRGKIRLATEDTKPTITLFKDANASTLIHEKGHEWVDQLLRLSSEDDAPIQMKKDAEAVRKYSGAAEDGVIPTRGHEKLARSFERYLMEGVAPSKELASVFEKFKQWLTNLYQTVEQLRAPITDDIRDVFDRLLAKTPERTVIARDRAPGEMLAKIHESDAYSTPHEHAAAVRDNIEKEIDLAIKQHAPEVMNELGTTGTETGRIEPTAESPAAPVPEGNTPRDSATSTEPSALPVSSSEARGEGRGLGEKPKSDQPTGPNSIVKPPESDLVDKAGNIRLDNFNGPEDIKRYARDLAASSDDFWPSRGGVISDAQRIQMAESLGLTIKDFNPKKPDGISSSVWAQAVQKLTFQSIEAVTDLGKKFADSGSVDDLAEYTQSKQRALMISNHFSNLTAESGRTQRVFNKADLKLTNDVMALLETENKGKTLFQLQEEAKKLSTLDTQAKRAKFLQDSQKPSFGDMILEYWVNGLISGPATHTTYMVGNTLSALWKAIPETGAAALIGKVHELFGKEGGGIKVGEIGAQLKGISEALPSALEKAGESLKTGLNALLPGEGEDTLPFQFGGRFTHNPLISNELKTWKELGADSYGVIKGLRDSFLATGQSIKSGEFLNNISEAPLFEKREAQAGAIPNFAVKGVPIPVGSIARAPSHGVAAIHSFFRTVNYSMEKSAIAYRTAVDEGLTGHDFAARVADVITNPNEETMAKSRATATNLTLMGQGGEFTKAVSKLTNASVNLPVFGNTKLLKFIDPFVKIGSNVIEQSVLRRTPLGILSSEIRADLSGVNGAEARDFAQARMLVGTGLLITAGGLAAEGIVSGSGPSDKGEAAMWRLAGNQAHSVRIGDTWYDIHRLGPLGMTMSIGADMYEVAHAIPEEDGSKVASMAAHAVAQNILDESFMRGPSELMLAATDSDRYGAAWVRNFAASFTPFSVGMAQEARAIDPYTRQTRTVMDAIKAKIPYVSEELYPRRDVWGEPIPNKDVFGIKGLSAIYEQKISQDPVNQTMASLGMGPAIPQRKIRGVELTDDQYDNYTRIAGRMSKLRLNNLIGNPGFAAVPAEKQIDLINKIITNSRENARKIIMMNNPDIMRQALDNKIHPLKK